MASEPKYAVIDTETGGLDPDKHSLLEVAFLPLERSADGLFYCAEEYTAKVIPEDGIYRTTVSALKINNIDLAEVQLPGYGWYSVEEIRESLLACGNVTAVGWNVNFDIRFMRDQLRLGAFFNYRSVDLHGVMAGLSLAGKMPYTGSLERTAAHFGVLPEKQLHRAVEDARLTLSVFNELLKLLKG